MRADFCAADAEVGGGELAREVDEDIVAARNGRRFERGVRGVHGMASRLVNWRM